MKILILRLSSIGDIVLTQPVPWILKEKLPDTTIDYLTKPAYKDVVEAFSCIDNIIEWKDKKNTIRMIRQNKYDLVIDLHSKLNTFLIKSLSGARKIITVRKRHWYRWALTKKLFSQPNESMTNLYLKTLNKINIKVGNISPVLYPNEELRSEINELFNEQEIDTKKILVGIFPGALHYTKCYPASSLARFIDLVPDKNNYQFIILGSRDDDQYAQEIIKRTGFKVFNLCGKVSLPELIVLVDSLNLVISNDSGPMHIAAALQKPQIAIFGGTHSVLGFSPLNYQALVLQANLSCQPCSTYGLEKCPLGTLDCMKAITEEHVLNAFQELIEQTKFI